MLKTFPITGGDVVFGKKAFTGLKDGLCQKSLLPGIAGSTAAETGAWILSEMSDT